MKNVAQNLTKFTLTLLLLLLPAYAMAEDGETAAATSHDIITTTQTIMGQPITVPTNPKLHAFLLTIAPGQSLPVHKHPFPRYAYVQNGELDVTLIDDNGAQNKVTHLVPGDFFVEAIDAWHYGTNNGTDPVDLLVIDQMPQDAENNVVMKD